MFLEQKQLLVVVVYTMCVPFSTEILYTTTAPENRPMPILILIGSPRQYRIPLGALVVYTAAAWTVGIGKYQLAVATCQFWAVDSERTYTRRATRPPLGNSNWA